MDYIGGHDATRLPRLPACRFCHGRKVKCDNTRPSCSLCVKHNEVCVTLEVDENPTFSRQYIRDLEQVVRTLESEVEASDRGGPDILPSRDTADSIEVSDGSQALPFGGAAGREGSPSANLEGGGISFMRHLLADSGWHEHDSTLLQDLTRNTGPAEAGIKSHALPPADEGRKIFDTYLLGSHVQNPFLLRQEVNRIFETVFSSWPGEIDERGSSHRPVSNHDLFRAFMILAVGSVLLYRNGVIKHHPYGYYLSSMKFLDDTILSRGLESVQDLLLVGRFAIYHHIGTSIWEIVRLSMRLCIEQGLHKPPLGTSNHSLLEEQLQRRVFWECYMIDRYSSITLNRPCALADKYVQIAFPADANDEDVEAADASGAFPDLDSFCDASSRLSRSQCTNTEMSVFFACLRLRQITSCIHAKFGHKDDSTSMPNDTTDTGAIYADLEELLSELHQWRSLTPVFNSPRSLYEMQDWYSLLYSRERLQLVRKAIDLVPKRNGIPPQDLLLLCLECAVGTISAFWKLFEPKKVTFTRSYFQTLFTAGLSIMYCMSAVGGIEPTSMKTATEAVATCEYILKQMVIELTDAKRYVSVYEALRRYVIRKYSRDLQTDMPPQEPGIPSTSNLWAQPSAEVPALQVPYAESNGIGTIDTEIPPVGGQEPNEAHVHQALGDLPILAAELGDIPPIHAAYIYSDPPISEGGGLSWDHVLWNMEAGLNEYAYGDLPGSLEDPLGLQNII